MRIRADKGEVLQTWVLESEIVFTTSSNEVNFSDKLSSMEITRSILILILFFFDRICVNRAVVQKSLV